jgi:hypothetical protein
MGVIGFLPDGTSHPYRLTVTRLDRCIGFLFGCRIYAAKSRREVVRLAACFE